MLVAWGHMAVDGVGCWWVGMQIRWDDCKREGREERCAWLPGDMVVSVGG